MILSETESKPKARETCAVVQFLVQFNSARVSVLLWLCSVLHCCAVSAVCNVEIELKCNVQIHAWCACVSVFSICFEFLTLHF
jgi:hypothetical protein